MVIIATLFVLSYAAVGQVQTETPTAFRIGERLSYNVSFQNFNNVAFFETYVVSRGKISGRDAIEVQSRIKTFDLVSAAFSLIDESRIVFVDPVTGLPIYITRTVNSGVTPKETIQNFLTAPSTNLDLLTLIFKARESNGVGTFAFSENDETSIATFQTSVSEKVKTDVGEFGTSVSTVQSTFLESRGIKDLRINFSSDENRLPVLIRFKTAKGSFTATLSGMNLEAKPGPETVPTPSQTPRPIATPTPKPTPPPYVDNVPLLKELAFELGENLEYKVTAGGTSVATLVLMARERKLFQNNDSLLLTAAVTRVDQIGGPFVVGDSLTAQVNPETLAPQNFEMKFGGKLASLNQLLSFDQRTGVISYGAKRSDAPVGTHSLLSLIYGIRSFNLKPSKNSTSPVNDTRVAVFWNDRPYIFVLRPNDADPITINGEKVAAQMISITTGNPQLDALALKVWLSVDDRRVPLRFSVGPYTADLVAGSNIFTR